MKHEKLELHENVFIEIHRKGDEHGETVLADIVHEDGAFDLMIGLIQLNNAANGMPTEEAVKYITHGREMAEALATCYSSMLNEKPTLLNRRWLRNIMKKLLAKLEGK